MTHLYLNHEDAVTLLDTSDLFVSRLLNGLHNEIILGSGRAWKPEFSFDMNYFYKLVLRSVSNFCQYGNGNMGGEQVIQPVNIPTFEEDEFRDGYFSSSGIASCFVSEVRKDSVEGGDPFDMRYACRIMNCFISSEENFVDIKNGMGKQVEPPRGEFPSWGF